MPWPLALTAVASRLQRTIETYGPHAVAIYLEPAPVNPPPPPHVASPEVAPVMAVPEELVHVDLVHYGPATQVSPFGRGATILFVVLSGLIVAAAAWSLTG